jgi:hypothetical protein
MSDTYDLHVQVEGAYGSISFEPYAGAVSEAGMTDEALAEIRNEMKQTYLKMFPSAMTAPRVHMRVVLRP